MDIKDFILTEATETETKPVTKPKRKPTIQYNILASNDMDFVVEKKGKRSKAIMAIIPSKEQYYINNIVKEDGKETAVSMPFSAENVKWFLSSLEDPMQLPVEWCNFLEKGKDFAMDFTRFIFQHGSLIKLGIAAYNDVSTDLIYVNEESPSLAKFLARVKKTTPKVSPIIHRYETYQPCACGAFDTASRYSGVAYLAIMEKIFGLDSTRNFVNAFVERDINFGSDVRGFVYLINTFYEANGIVDFLDENRRGQNYQYPKYDIKKEHLGKNNARIDINAFTEYALLYQREGFNSLKDFFNSLKDDWDMQNQLFGEIKDKYPKNLATHHNQLSVKLRYISAELDKKKFADYYERQKDMAWSNKEYIIKVPETATDMIDEAIQQDNCLRSYLHKVMDGQTNIFFLRKKAAPDKSLVTIEVRDGGIVQAKAHFNKTPAPKEMEAIRLWANAKKINA